jgi:hypothetical protein
MMATRLHMMHVVQFTEEDYNLLKGTLYPVTTIRLDWNLYTMQDSFVVTQKLDHRQTNDLDPTF